MSLGVKYLHHGKVFMVEDNLMHLSAMRLTHEEEEEEEVCGCSLLLCSPT